MTSRAVRTLKIRVVHSLTIQAGSLKTIFVGRSRTANVMALRAAAGGWRLGTRKCGEEAEGRAVRGVSLAMIGAEPSRRTPQSLNQSSRC
jgi:hypothetical protein